MKDLRKEVEAIIRDVYGFDESVAITDITVNFKVATSSMNGTVPTAGREYPALAPIKKRQYKKRGGSKSLHREYTTSKSDIACMRHFFRIWEKKDLFTGEQLNFVAQTRGVKYPHMSQETLSRLRAIFEEVREKLLFKKRKGVETNV